MPMNLIEPGFFHKGYNSTFIIYFVFLMYIFLHNNIIHWCYMYIYTYTYAHKHTYTYKHTSYIHI